nr:MAG TPA: hypothetical protein [Caudoviricetes sp.]
MIFYANIVNTLYNRNKVGYNQKGSLSGCLLYLLPKQSQLVYSRIKRRILPVPRNHRYHRIKVLSAIENLCAFVQLKFPGRVSLIIERFFSPG